MVRFKNVTEGSERLDYGKHLVRISECRNSKKDGTIMLDNEDCEIWSVTFENQDGTKHYEYFRFTGGLANKTGHLFKAIGLLKEDEKLQDCDKDFECADIVGKKLYITIEENTKATDEKYRKQIGFDGFEKYSGKKEEKKVVVDAPWD